MGSSTFQDTMCYKCIYVIEVDDDAHWGLVKVGDATVRTSLDADELPPNSEPLQKAAHKRIKSYTNTAGLPYRLLYTELAVRVIDEGGRMVRRRFRDNDVRRVLLNSGIENVKLGDTTGREWYRTGVPTVKKAIAAVKAGEWSLPGTTIEYETPPFEFRPEQLDAADFTVKRFKKTDRVLWNAKMRFGKTLTALEVIRRMELERVAILTHRPAVEDGWHEDFNKIFYGDTEYRFGSRKTVSLDRLLDRHKPFVYFASIQDTRGSEAVGGSFPKNELLFNTLWDLVIIDEAHEGTQTELGKETVSTVVKADDGHTKTLRLSGTPFNIIGDFPASDIYTWDYVMEQRRKKEWDETHVGETNPYEDLPSLSIYTYDLGSVFANSAYAGGDEVAFNFREFFRTWTGDLKRDRKPLPEDAHVGGFVHEGDIRSFLNLLTAEDPDTLYPFSSERYRNMFRHSLWMVPGVKEAQALKALMMEHPVFGSGAFEVVNVAGKGDEEMDADKALHGVRDAIRRNNLVGNYTVTLSCGRLTTGVTVPEWSAVLMLSGSYSTSAANYMQTIFRVQSPGEIDGKAKDKAYVFDFAPDRTLKMVAEAVKVSAKPGGTGDDDRQRLDDFLNFCPVIGMAGSKMTKYDTDHMLQQLKRAYADRVVSSGFEDESLYTDDLFRLDQEDAAAFNDLSNIISKSTNERSGSKITINDQGLTEEEHEKAKRASKKPKQKRSKEEQELVDALNKAKEDRKKAIATLRQISVRMPLLVFGADIPTTADLTLDAFVQMVDEASWRQFMPKGVTKEVFSKFRRFYDEDVFTAAARRIRDIARHADTLEPTERTMQIASLFSYFKNPDKETVLTPWRVVNMQLGDCLGGWNFFDDDCKETLDEPRYVEREVVTHRAFGWRHARVLEMNSKTGLYPLFATYSIYRSRLAEESDDLDLDGKRSLWMRTVSENVFVLCMTKMADAITRRVLVGYSDGEPIRSVWCKDLIDTLRTNKEEFRDKIKSPSFWGMEGDGMEFSAVVGNPAYQMRDGGYSASASPVYQEFVKTAICLNPDYVSMITPSRWFAGGKGLDKYRDEMLSDHHISRIVDFPRLYEPFPNVKIRGGISYFLWDKEHDGLCAVQTIENGKQVGESVERDIGEFDVLVRRNEAVPILRKVMAKGEQTLDANMSSSKPFGLRTYVHGKSSPDGMADPVKFYGSQKITWMERADIPTNADWIDDWKVLLPTVQGTSSAIEKRFISKIIVAGPGTACSETYLVARRFEDENKAQNYASYLRTRLVRLLVSCRKLTQHAARDVYSFVPDVEYDHEWTDEMLYERYGITQEEIAFIESVVIPLD